jgi:L-cysteate sulfo-lyase
MQDQSSTWLSGDSMSFEACRNEAGNQIAAAASASASVGDQSISQFYTARLKAMTRAGVIVTPDDLEQALARFARVSLIASPTPIQRSTRLEAALGAGAHGVQLFVKRDDQMDVGGGGNKLRKLEYLLAEAQVQEADTVITVGALQSNHARLTAAASARIGLARELYLTKTVQRTDGDYERSGNLVLETIFVAQIYKLVQGSNALEQHMNVRALWLA